LMIVPALDRLITPSRFRFSSAYDAGNGRMASRTSRRHHLIEEIGCWQDKLERDGEIEVCAGLRVAQEGLVHMILAPSHIERIPIIWHFQKALRSRL